LHFSGYVNTQTGSDCTLIISVNGKTKPIHYASGTDKDFIEDFEISSFETPEIRMTVFVLAQRGPKAANAQPAIDILAIDTDLTVAKKRKRKKK
jgi:hypothetical protein